jgi:ATP-dependent Clp protease ATP-binding subunit ClpA
MFSTELSYALEAAYREAANRKHNFFCIEHILFALLFDAHVMTILQACGVDIDKLKAALEEFFDNELEQVDPQVLGRDSGGPIQTDAVQRILQKAILHSQSTNKNIITAQEVLIALYSEPDSHAVYFLLEQGVSRLDILNYVSHGMTKEGAADSDGSFIREPGMAGADGEEERHKGPPASLLKKLTEDLTEKARLGLLDPVIGREEEISRTLKILSRRLKNNPLFLGDPGVGKSALVHGLAQRIADGDVPDVLQDAQLFALHIGTLVAGTKFRGEFEDRLKGILDQLQKLPKAILFIDEMHTMVGAGATGSGSLDAANLLKPILASGKIRCIGATTYDDYKKSIEKDRALSRRFSVVEISEPSIDDTIEILKGLQDKFEKHHQVKYSAAALKAAAHLSAKFITDKLLPDKAIDVIDEAGAENRNLPAAKRKKSLTEKEIERVVSAMARVPVKSISNSDRDLLQSLLSNLQGKVFGQDQAVESIVRAIKRGRASLKRSTRPVGCFLFAGPTGVGKTELAKVLADELGVRFHRFDMSEFMEKHAVSRLIGAPPGYVGYEEGGQLTDLVRKHPYAVLLFDEIEKAHHDIYNILLQVMDDARLTDAQGRVTDFRNVILIMTSNAGSEKSASIGFGDSRGEAHRDQAIKSAFKPEFRNRLDEVIYFSALAPEVVEKIVDKFVLELEDQLSERKVTFEISPEARSWLAKKGFDPVLGARPMSRLIEREIKDPLADEILFGKLEKGGKVAIVLEKDKLTFKIL